MGEGFVEVTGDKVSILTDMAIKAERILTKPRRRSPASGRKPGSRKSWTTKRSPSKAALDHSLAQLKVKRRVR